MNERMISKHDWKDGDGVWLLKAGSTYETSDCPTTHTPNGELGPQLIVVTCEDDKYRIRQKSDFMYIYKHREERLKEIGI